MAHDDRGAVTVEAALALGTLTLFLVLAVGAMTAVVASVRCTDAARELARLAARGEPDRGRAVAAELAPAGAVLTVRSEDGTAGAVGLVVAVVAAPPLPPLPVTVSGRAVAAREPGVGP